MDYDEIEALKTQNPNYEQDPCYIEWKAEQDDSPNEIDYLDEMIENHHERNPYNRIQLPARLVNLQLVLCRQVLITNCLGFF